jgi:KDO2-lipid IV(A) lauroyltransferase
MKHPIRRWLLWLLFWPLWGVILILPAPVARELGAWLGRLVYRCSSRERTRALEHLQLAFGRERSPQELERIARACFANLGRNACEFLSWPKLRLQTLERHLTIEGRAQLDRVLREPGRGVILLTAHLGNWEIIGAYLGLLGYRGGVVARHLRYPEYERWQIALRRRTHIETFVRDSSVKELLRRLRDNQCIGMLPDQDVDSVEGVFVNFFGRPAYTPTGPVTLAQATGAALLPVFCLRERGRFRIVFEEPVRLVSSGNTRQDLQENTARWSRIVEGYIRRYPEQWVWMHRRWKTQPSIS